MILIKIISCLSVCCVAERFDFINMQLIVCRFNVRTNLSQLIKLFCHLLFGQPISVKVRPQFFKFVEIGNILIAKFSNFVKVGVGKDKLIFYQSGKLHDSNKSASNYWNCCPDCPAEDTACREDKHKNNIPFSDCSLPIEIKSQIIISKFCVHHFVPNFVSHFCRLKMGANGLQLAECKNGYRYTPNFSRHFQPFLFWQGAVIRWHGSISRMFNRRKVKKKIKILGRQF